MGQAATQTPHWTQRSASMTASSSSQNQTLPGASSMSFISSRILKPAMSRPPLLARVARSSAFGSAPRPLVEALAVAPLGPVAGDRAASASGTSSAGFAPSTQSMNAASRAEAAAEPDVDALHDRVVASWRSRPGSRCRRSGAGRRRPSSRRSASARASPARRCPTCASSSRAHSTALALVSTMREAAELAAGAGHHAALERARVRRVARQQRLGQQSSTRSSGTPVRIRFWSVASAPPSPYSPARRPASTEVLAAPCARRGR